MFASNLSLPRLTSAIAVAALAVGAVTAVPSIARAAVTCFDFETIAAGSTFNIGDTLTIPTGEVRMVPLLPNAPSFGFARVVVSNFANGSIDQELNLNNIGMRIVLDETCDRAAFRYDDHGGHVNFELNGDVFEVDDLSDLSLPGVTVTENVVAGGKRGVVTIEGDIDSFGVGGQEFHIDDVCIDC